MKKTIFSLTLAAVSSVMLSCASPTEDVYVVLAPESFVNQETDSLEAADWEAVVARLQKRHNAELLRFAERPQEQLEELRRISPRYVAIVDLPEHIGRDYVIALNQMSRQLDSDPYADFLWGIITGYDADAAMRMLEHSEEPMVIRTGVGSILELESAKWFDAYAYVDDHQVGLCGEKQYGEDTLTHRRISYKTDMTGANERIRRFVQRHFGDTVPDVLRQFLEYYESYKPDLVVTASHATEKNLEMPGSVGNIRCRDGRLYIDYPGKQNFVPDRDSRMVYLPIGNCLIGNVDNTRNSMAIAWMNSQQATTFVGYVVTTWYGRNGWGGLKYLITNPGRYSVAEAFYLNQQDMMAQMAEWNDSLTVAPFDYDCDYFRKLPARLTEMAAPGELSPDEMIFWLGFWHDRDVLAYYGDPKWDVRMQQVSGETDFTVTSRIEPNPNTGENQPAHRCVITVKTNPDFSLDRMKGAGFKQEHVLDLPFSYFFPKRLKNPKLPEGESRHIVVDENFLFWYEPSMEPGQSYEIVVLTD